jgi:hypothetical protein
MNAATVKLLQVGDRVRLRDSTGVNDSGTIIEVLPGDYARVRWNDVSIQTTHRLHALEDAAISADVTQVLRSLSDPGKDIAGE